MEDSRTFYWSSRTTSWITAYAVQLPEVPQVPMERRHFIYYLLYLYLYLYRLAWRKDSSRHFLVYSPPGGYSSGSRKCCMYRTVGLQNNAAWSFNPTALQLRSPPPHGHLRRRGPNPSRQPCSLPRYYYLVGGSRAFAGFYAPASLAL
jgi:hypothetical protein